MTYSSYSVQVVSWLLATVMKGHLVKEYKGF